MRAGESDEPERGDRAAGHHHPPRADPPERFHQQRAAQAHGYVERRGAAEHQRQRKVEIGRNPVAGNRRQAKRAPADDLRNR
ncbi:MULTISPECIES: hypothetical protein [unclassified Bradyrhizobium]